MSGPYLGKCKWDCIETWFIDRGQYEEGQCTKNIILPCILTELFPHNHVFISVACPAHILLSKKGKLETKLV